ncbi:hypothetical protein PSQ19_01430 [Devosia algicola]|uniref:Uncharacterized protein n=1 Tax=Devosia algicola TaxID=3026418 RepID=A0ABY7YNM8_9HYPH|nr:hypothetical protein [Devosia algicola]WDR02916.1 hypothetical protein PSQ19_01430 [Devosia algicola]
MAVPGWITRLRPRTLLATAMPGAVYALSFGGLGDLLGGATPSGPEHSHNHVLGMPVKLLLVSGVVHLLLLAIGLSLPSRPLERPRDRPIVVEIVSPGQYEAATAPGPTPMAVPADAIETPSPVRIGQPSSATAGSAEI